MNEVVSLHIGQAGIDLGTEVWRLKCLEHQISEDGMMSDGEVSRVITQNDHHYKQFFNLSEKGKITPLAAHFDFDREGTDKIRYGEFRHLFDSSQILSGKQDAGNNFARGYIALGESMIDMYLDRVRRIVEKCESPNSFILYHSLAGGTGSGFTSLLLERLSDQFRGRRKMNFPIMSSKSDTKIVVEPYNSVLCASKLLEHSDVVIPLQNLATRRILVNQLQCEEWPTDYIAMNKLMARTVCETTINMRYQACLNESIGQILKNLIPYQSFKFIVPSLSPLVPKNTEIPTLCQMSANILSHENCMVDLQPKQGKLMGLSMYYRGDNMIPKDVNYAFKALKFRNDVHFVDWVPTGVKVGINYKPRSFLPDQIIPKTQQSLFTLSNTTAMKTCFERMSTHFGLIFCKKAFTHWYTGQGLDEMRMAESWEAIQTVIDDYGQASKQVQEEEEQDSS